MSSSTPSVHVPSVDCADWRNNPDGTGSWTVTRVASRGPLLRTASVKVTWPPGCRVAVEAVLVSARSAPGTGDSTICVSVTHDVAGGVGDAQLDPGGPSTSLDTRPSADLWIFTE
jgi:hypothetical protein